MYQDGSVRAEKWEQGYCFVVQFIVDVDDLGTEVLDMLGDLQAELNYYLIDKREDDPWAYAVYHCVSRANSYSSVHWVYFGCPHAAYGQRSP